MYCNFVAEFELTDLELVDIGPRIIKIGPEMPILEQFPVLVKNIDFHGIAISTCMYGRGLKIEPVY